MPVSGLPVAVIVNNLHRQERKKPTWRNTRRYSTTSAYSLTSPSAHPGCSLSSHPTTSLEKAAFKRFATLPSLQSYAVERGIQQGIPWNFRIFSEFAILLPVVPLGRDC